MSAQPGSTYGDRFVFTGTGVAGSPATPALTLHAGTGSPEGVVVASVGDLYVRHDGILGSPPEVIYVKATGTATDTGWQVLL